MKLKKNPFLKIFRRIILNNFNFLEVSIDKNLRSYPGKKIVFKSKGFFLR